MQLVQMRKRTFNVMDFEPCEASRALEGRPVLDKVAVLSLYVAPALKGRCSCCVCPSVAVVVICLTDALFCGEDLRLRSGREDSEKGNIPSWAQAPPDTPAPSPVTSRNPGCSALSPREMKPSRLRLATIIR